MKKIFTILSVLLISSTLYAQTPNEMSYQAVIRNTDGALVSSQLVGIQISIIRDTPNGSAVYIETHQPTTNANGLVSFKIGNGTVVSGSFNSINWGNGPFVVLTETDLDGGTNYTISGLSPLLSVPYALHAKVADSVIGGLNESDPIFNNSVAGAITAADTTRWNQNLDSTQIANLGFQAGSHTVNTDSQNLVFTGTTLSISNGNAVNLAALDTDTQIDSAGISALGFVAGAHTVDTDTQLDSAGVAALGFVAGAHPVNTDNQTISLSGTTLAIAGGNTVDLSSVNQNTQLDSAGVAALGFVAGTHPVNTDAQTLSFSGSTLSIANGNNVDLSGIDTDSQIDSMGIASFGFVAGSHTVNTDNQNITLSGTNLSISGGNTLDLSPIDTDDQTISLSGSTLSITGGNNVDLSSIDTDTDTQLDSAGIAALGYVAGPHVTGANTQISFNDNGSVGNDAELVYNKTTNQMGVGTSAVNASAALEVNSTTGGFMLPRMTTTQRDAIPSPQVGLMIFNTDSGAFQGFAGFNNGVDLTINHNTFLGTLTFSGQSFTAVSNGLWTEVILDFQSAVTGGTLQIFNGNTVSGVPIQTVSFTVGAGQQGIVLDTPIQLVAGQQYTVFTNVPCRYYPFSTYAGGSSWTVSLAFPGDLWMQIITGNATWKNLHN